MSGMLWNKLIKRSLTDGCRFNPKTGYGEDAEFLWQVLQNTNSMIVTNEILYHHVPDENSISHLSYSEKSIQQFLCGRKSMRIHQLFILNI